MFEYLEFKDKSSSTPSTFWEIQCYNNILTTRYGEVNREGLSQTVSFQSEEETQKTFDHLVTQQLKKGYKENTFDKQYFQVIDQIVETLLAYERVSDIDLDLEKPDCSLYMEWKLPRSYRYLLRKYGRIGYFDMEGTWGVDWDDIHDRADDSVREEFEGAVFFQKMHGPYVADSYCFMINSPAGNSEVEIKEFPHDDSPSVCESNFSRHLYEYFSNYFYDNFGVKCDKGEDLYQAIDRVMKTRPQILTQS